MRTREEQIEDLANDVAAVVCTDAEGIALAQKHILEAERRAEHRVRAEIGRDSERLDWLERQPKTVMTDRKNSRVTFHSPAIGPWGDVRSAIDNARENVND